MRSKSSSKFSLEKLIESEGIGIEILHPGGLEITKELAELCRINENSYVLDVASGTGETACFLAETFGCRVVGVDYSAYMVKRAREKANAKGLDVEFKVADAHNLPFPANSFDAVISECTTCLLDKERAIREMVRVAKAGGYVGIHDVCWKGDVPEEMKIRLAEIEGEKPETLEGWKILFENAGLADVIAIDRSSLIHEWIEELKKQIGILGQVKIFLKAISKWGFESYRIIREVEKIYQSPYIGYGIIVGRKC